MSDRETEAWTWPDALDALTAAPESHRLLFENEVTRVLEARIGPGETAQLHTHRWPAVLYVLSLGHFVRRDGEGPSLSTRAKPAPCRIPAPQSGPVLSLLTRSRTSMRSRFASSASS